MPAQRERRRILRVLLSTVASGALLHGTLTTAGAQETPRPQPTTQPTTMPTTRVALKFSEAQVGSVLDKLSSDYGFEIATNEAGSDTRITVISDNPIPA